MLFDECFGVSLVAEAEHLIPLVLPNDRVAVPGKREAVGPAERLELFVIGTRTLLFEKADPVEETPLGNPLYARLAMRHWPTSRSPSPRNASAFDIIRPSNSSADLVGIPAR